MIVPAAVVQRDRGALGSGVEVSPVDPAAIHSESDQWRVYGGGAVVGRSVQANALGVEAIQMVMGKAAATT